MLTSVNSGNPVNIMNKAEICFNLAKKRSLQLKLDHIHYKNKFDEAVYNKENVRTSTRDFFDNDKKRLIVDKFYAETELCRDREMSALNKWNAFDRDNGLRDSRSFIHERMPANLKNQLSLDFETTPKGLTVPKVPRAPVENWESIIKTVLQNAANVPYRPSDKFSWLHHHKQIVKFPKPTKRIENVINPHQRPFISNKWPIGHTSPRRVDIVTQYPLNWTQSLFRNVGGATEYLIKGTTNTFSWFVETIYYFRGFLRTLP